MASGKSGRDGEGGAAAAKPTHSPTRFSVRETWGQSWFQEDPAWARGVHGHRVRLGAIIALSALYPYDVNFILLNTFPPGEPPSFDFPRVLLA